MKLRVAAPFVLPLENVGSTGVLRYRTRDRSESHAWWGMYLLLLAGTCALGMAMWIRAPFDLPTLVFFFCFFVVVTVLAAVIAVNEAVDEELECDPLRGHVRFIRHSWFRHRVLAEGPLDEIRCVRHPVCIKVYERHGLVWAGHALAVHFRDQWFPIACLATEEEAERVLNEAPQWIRQRYSPSGEPRTCRGDINVSPRTLLRMVRSTWNSWK